MHLFLPKTIKFPNTQALSMCMEGNLIQVDNIVSMIQLSCPECENLVIADLRLEENDIKLPQDVDYIIKKMIGVTKHYSFRGMTNCECGNIVISCLTVSAHGNRSEM